MLSMFPYPSGTLHMGHVRVYTYGDCLARFHRLRGSDVLYPMGWDAFGLPADNAARERGLDPRTWTVSNIAHMRAQLDTLGISFNWERQISTCEPDYFRWTQWLFLQLHKQGLAYQKEAFVNWDPVDETVLANEQVDANGRSWRSGAIVEQKKLRQWFFEITKFAEPLLKGLDALPEWPAQVKKMQEAWIGRSEGVMVQFGPIPVFTTRVETLMGVSFIAVAPDFGPHPESVTHPLTGESLPVVAADYVLADYGTGAVMGVPGHDERDRAFAESHSLPIVSVLDSDSGALINSGPFTGLDQIAARAAIEKALVETDKGAFHAAYRLRDWLISRQRPWGAPIPVVHCAGACGAVPVPEDGLPVPLAPRDDPVRLDEWLNCACPSCGGPAKRDTDTMDTFVDSSWYYLRYTDPQSTDRPASANQWMAVDTYIGGVEHAVLHLLYARFINMFLHGQGWSPAPEPFKALLTQGMVQSKTFRLAESNRPVPATEVDVERGVHLNSGEAVKVSWEKMSKSKLNGVDPQAMVAAYGADATRLYVMFRAPPHMALEWDESGIQGMKRWLGRLWYLLSTPLDCDAKSKSKKEDIVADALMTCINQVTLDLSQRYGFNTAIAALMTLSNVLKKTSPSPVWLEARDALLIMLAPLAPHFASESWHVLHPDQDVFAQSWPEISAATVLAKEAATKPQSEDSSVSVNVMVNGKRRASVEMSLKTLAGSDRDAILNGVHSSVHKWIGGESVSPHDMIVVPKQRLVNLVTKKS